MKSVGNSGYSGMGFTTSVPTSGNASGYPYRPNDGLGLSVHGSGFVFNNGASANLNGYWSDSYTNDPGVTRVTASPEAAFLNEASVDDWYKVVLTVVRDSATTMDTRVEVWPSDSSGNLDNVAPEAVSEINDRTVTALLNAPVIYAYFNFSGNRVYNFDNFSVDLSGGASVIEEGAPVVLTDAAVNCAAGLGMEGTVTDDGSSSILERGFVYSTSTGPDLSDTVAAVSGTTGSYSFESSTLTNGTYYVRAYAINASGTSFGSEISVPVDSSVTAECEFSGGGGSGGGGSGGGGANELADTGIEPMGVTVTGLALLTAGALILARRRNSRREAARF